MSARRLAVRAVLLVSAGLLPFGCGDDSDSINWCTEEQDTDTIPAKGTVTIHYEGIWAPKSTVQIKPFVRDAGQGVLIIQGCGRKNGDLWRWRAGVSGVKDGAREVMLTADEDKARYIDHLRLCRDGSCQEGHDQEIATSDATHPAEGVVHTFSLKQGTFSASVDEAPNTYESVSIEIDITWDPSAKP